VRRLKDKAPKKVLAAFPRGESGASIRHESESTATERAAPSAL